MVERSAGRGRLIAVGTGIRIVGQITTEAIAWIRRADRVFTLISDPVADETIRRLNPGGVESLSTFYEDRKPREITYRQMAGRVMECVREGSITCIASYGHPGVFADPVHEAVRRAREEGFPAQILPAISAEDCLFADLGVDPARSGCQSYDATDFLVHGRMIDPSSCLILWQIGAVGEPLFRADGYPLSLLPILVDRLARIHPLGHVGYLYEAPAHLGAGPMIRAVALGSLTGERFSTSSTLYIPPSRPPRPDPDVVARINSMRGQ
ncbi:SAM-dependent methyltransferase [Paludisphaera mucosa]|uniref:SAM-dependent methyltransferase n=1 Tax=Paludisphaera mucosa TaxID=3030827 RepID=A0ABT6FL34_9BACT|nr:SAM-dependent methyltransferase [Paludisphaera mucosa]MDG3008287.1 SAM-dependent methyltransferase [Paludisphaera mucosa]